MHRTVQQLFQVAPKAGLLEEPASPLHVDEQIEIALQSVLSSGNRSEHLHPSGAMKRGHSLDFVAPLTQLLHSPWYHHPVLTPGGMQDVVVAGTRVA